MNLHQSDIFARLGRFLNRKAMPRRLEGKPDAERDEVTALGNALARKAPRGADALAAWWPSFEARLGEDCGAGWPSETQIANAAIGALKASPVAILSGQSSGVDMRPEAISARRIQRGEGIGEEWLYGVRACELIATGLVDRATMDRYRSAAYFARKRFYGEAPALEWEVKAKAEHEIARQVYGQRDVVKRDAHVPDKRAPQREEAFQ